MIVASQHIPAFIDGVTGGVATVASVEALLAVPWIAQWPTLDPKRTFHRWSVSHLPGLTRDRLIAEFDGGAFWWVVAYLEHDAPIDLPTFDPPHAAPARRAADRSS